MKFNLKLLFATVTVITLAHSVWCAPAVAEEAEETEVVPAEHRTGRKDSAVQQEGRVWRIPLMKKKLLLLKFKKLLPLTTLPFLLLRSGDGDAGQLVSVVPVGGSGDLQSLLQSADSQSGSQTFAIPSDLLQEQMVEVAAADESDDTTADSYDDGNTEVIEIGDDSEKPIAMNAAKKISSYAGLSGLSGLSGLTSRLSGHQGLVQALGGQTPIIIYAVPQQVEYARASSRSNKYKRRYVTRI